MRRPLRRYGGGSLRWLGSTRKLTVSTWNGATLKHDDSHKRKLRQATVHELARHSDILCLQESHLGIIEFLALFPELQEKFHVAVVEGTTSTGGNVTLIRKNKFGTELVAARFVVVT